MRADNKGCKEEYEACMTKNIKTNNSHVFKYMKDRKSARMVVEPLREQKGRLK